MYVKGVQRCVDVEGKGHTKHPEEHMLRAHRDYLQLTLLSRMV